MPADFVDRLAALHRERIAFLDALAHLEPSRRAASPEPGTWSAVEIAEHVYRVEETTLRGLEKQLAVGDARRDVGAYSRMGVVLLLAAMRSPKKLKVPDGARGVAPEGMDYEAVLSAWVGLDPRWEAAVSAFPAALARTPLLRHPVAGPLTLDDALRFLVAHTSRHRRQLARATRAGEAT